MKRAVIMCRVSSDEQAKGYSLDIQYDQLKNYCHRNNIEIIKEYREDHSARNFNRPEYQKFLEFVKKNKGLFDLLLVTSWDRFSRNLTDSLVMLRTLEKYGVKVQAIEQPIDMSIPENKAMLAIFLAIPEIDNDRRSIKIRGGIRASLKAGRWARKAPIGYRNSRDEKNKPIVLPDNNAKYIFNAFKTFSEGKLQSDILFDLRKEGVVISRSNFSKLLRNPFYIGKIIVPKFEDEPTEIIDGIHKGIIDQDLFCKVQEVLSGKNKHKITGYSFYSEDFPLRGIIFCSKCESKMTASKSRSATGKRYAYYHCNACKSERFSANELNESMLQLLSDFKFNKESKLLYELMVKELLVSKNNEETISKEKLNTDLVDQELRIEKLQDLLVDGLIDKDSYIQTMERYTKKKRELSRSIESLNSMDNEYKVWLKSGIYLLSDLKEFYYKSNISDKQSLISSIFPEKLFFDGEKCRTQRINEVLRLMLLIDKGLKNKKSGQYSKKLELSTLVESERIELSSKQAIEELSTRLFPD
jgi:site-specific DNA recombinase